MAAADGALGRGVDDALTVAEVGEDALVAAFAPLLPPAPTALVGNGDDCAVLAAPDGRACVSTDVLVEDHHFRLDWSGPEEVGQRAAAQNLADAAGMGARPVALVVGLVLPPTTTVGWVRGLARGLTRGCARCGAGVVGGDLSAGENVVVAVTVLGDLEGRDPVLRDGARAGDVVVHVGRPGRSAAGLALLRAGIDEAALDGMDGMDGAAGRADGAAGRADGGIGRTDGAAGRADGGIGRTDGGAAATARRCLSLHRVPKPPLAAGPELARCGATAMMDVSDSLLRDAGRIARASGVVLDLDDPAAPGAALGADVAALVPVAALVHGSGGRSGRERERGSFGVAPRTGTAVGSGPVGSGPVGSGLAEDDAALARTWVLTGGEDHGMLATVPGDAVDRLPAGTGVIGRVRAVAPDGAPGVLVGGVTPGSDLGWDHFRR